MSRNRKDLDTGTFLSGNAPAALRSIVSEAEHEMGKGLTADLAVENALAQVGQSGNEELRRGAMETVSRIHSQAAQGKPPLSRGSDRRIDGPLPKRFGAGEHSGGFRG